MIDQFNLANSHLQFKICIFHYQIYLNSNQPTFIGQSDVTLCRKGSEGVVERKLKLVVNKNILFVILILLLMKNPQIFFFDVVRQQFFSHDLFKMYVIFECVEGF